MKPTNTKKAITARRTLPDRTIMRTLECGHEQLEPRGGKAKHETHALCKACREVNRLAIEEAARRVATEPTPALENG